MKPFTMQMTHGLPLLFGGIIAFGIVDPAHATDSVCIYQSRSYSEGAFICVQKSLMQACTFEGGRLVWRIVLDKDVGERCVTSTPSSEANKRTIRRARIARQFVTPREPVSAKCFVFNSKRYCE